ncbi:unnamed protein product [Rhizophagus irregularis]|nr:unnamed protein product [Rhizophagus irregularis]CAB4417308.1 unnamed protein product [Rhizophagus irregularis]
MNNFIEKILILILVFTTITFAVPLNYNQEACPTGFGRCIDGRALTENDALSRRFPKIKLPKLGLILKSPFINGPSLSSVWKCLDSFCVYDNKGDHLGSMDPSNGNMTKPPLYIYSNLVQPSV